MDGEIEYRLKSKKEKLEIKNVVQNDHYVEITLPKSVVDKVKFDKLFVEAYNICSLFSFKTFNNEVIVRLSILNLKKHFLLYFVQLLSLIKDEIDKYQV